MSAKNIDYRGRWRNQTVSFRVTPEEKKAINTRQGPGRGRRGPE